MHIHALRIKNFRRLKDTVIDLGKEISIFVGSNNSGKTSTIEALRLFTNAQKAQFSINDFSSDCWNSIINFGKNVDGVLLSNISIDFWFHVEESDVHRVIDILPSLDWEDVPVGLRVEFTAIDENKLLENFHEEFAKAKENIQTDDSGNITYHPWPENLYAYLSEKLSSEYELRYYVLDHSSFDDSFGELEEYTPLQILPEKNRGGGKEILNSLLRVDFLGAQRHMSDDTQRARAEDLSRRLSNFYTRNLEQSDDNLDAIRVLKESENMLNEHLKRVFKPVLDRLSDLGYPGVDNPGLLLKTALNPATMMKNNGGTEVHYSLLGAAPDDDIQTLPDSYNGLGYKNLIYMVVELLDTHTRWLDIQENRPPLHLVFIEEPEAHLHVQLQQVFIRRIIDLLKIEESEADYYRSQIVVTTHSPHILYERGFQPIRYFRRETIDGLQTSEVLNLSKFYDNEPDNRNFLERYLKLTHCDLFFADAAVLVEGNVERLLVPQMIEKEAKELTKAYLSILEVGGAFSHKFKSLIEFLGITVLIITDIDSVSGEVIEEQGCDDDDDDKCGSTCMVHDEGAVTSNYMLKNWIPNKANITDLLAASEEDRTQVATEESSALVHVVYQTKVPVTWNGETKNLAGRTLEEAFAFQNFEWCQCIEQRPVKLRIPKNDDLSLDELVNRLHKRIKGSSFKKTDFALELLMQNPDDWVSPSYITQGLRWLQDQITSTQEEIEEKLHGEVV